MLISKTLESEKENKMENRNVKSRDVFWWGKRRRGGGKGRYLKKSAKGEEGRGGREGEMWDEGTRLSLLACLNALPFKSLHPDPTSPPSCCFSFSFSLTRSLSKFANTFSKFTANPRHKIPNINPSYYLLLITTGLKIIGNVNLKELCLRFCHKKKKSQ